MSVPSIPAALGSLARVTLRRTLRRKTLWVAAVISVLPAVFASQMHGHSVINAADDTFGVCKLLLAILPPLFVASAIGEEIEDRTATYLWSRPLARWTVVVGKLIALAPIVIACMAASWLVAAKLVLHYDGDSDAMLALAAGALATSMASAGIASLVPRYGMALTIMYILADLMIGALPTSLAKITMTFHVTTIASIHADAHDKLSSAGALAAIAIVWLVAGLRRIRRLEV